MRTVFEDGNYPTFHRGAGLICSATLFLMDLNQECLSVLRLCAEVQSGGRGQNVVTPPPPLMTKPEDEKKKDEISMEGEKRAGTEDSPSRETHAGTCSLPGQRLASASESILLRMEACVSPQAPA